MIRPQTRLGRNALWMILSRFGAQGLAVIFTILLARRLGIEGFGAYAFVAAIIFVTNALTTFGTDMLLIREIAAKDDLSRLPTALLVQLVLSVVFIAAVWIFGSWIPNQGRETIMALKLYSLALIPMAFLTIFTTALRGIQRMDAYMFLAIAVSVLQVGVVLLPILTLVLLSVFLLSIQVIVAVFGGFLCAFTIPNFWQTWSKPSFNFSSFLKDAAPIALLTVLGMLYQRLNIYTVSMITNATQTGLYSAAARMVEASKTIHIAVFTALYPAMAQEMGRWSSGREQSKRTYRDQRLAMRYLLAGATLITLILFVFAKPLITLFYGQEYIASANILRVIAWTLIPFTVNSYLTLSLLASNQEKIVGRALTVSLSALVILNLWWIPARGPEGSAWAALIAECIQSAFLLAGAGSRVPLQGEVHEFSHLP